MATLLEDRGVRSTNQGSELDPCVCNLEPVTAEELQELLGGMGFDTGEGPRWQLDQDADVWTLTEGDQQ